MYPRLVGKYSVRLQVVSTHESMGKLVMEGWNMVAFTIESSSVIQAINPFLCFQNLKQFCREQP